MADEEESSNLENSRRDFLKFASIGAVISTTGCSRLVCLKNPENNLPEQNNPIEFEISRSADHLYARVEAWNMQFKTRGNKSYLVPKSLNSYFVFIFPPQHYTETTIPIEGEVESKLSPKLDKLLDNIQIFPANESRLVFKVNELDKIELTIDSLLDWNKFKYQTKDLDELRDGIKTEKELTSTERRHFLGFDWAKDKDLNKYSAIEIPWGVYLQPVEDVSEFEWKHPKTPVKHNGRTELWFSLLENKYGRELNLAFEVQDVRGLEKFVPEKTVIVDKTKTKTHYYKDTFEYSQLQSITECSPVTNFDRLEIAGSLSNRFVYTGKGPTKTDSLIYQLSDGTEVPTNACYVDGRSLDVQTFGVSSLGGWLTLKAEWEPEPSCALKSWSHLATMGRDHQVEFKRAGFLYPFGIPAELVILSEREFVKDIEGHYVAPLLKRAFIQIPQPNQLDLDHSETPFSKLSVSTIKTPPLDIPPSGNFIEYAMCDYFLPIVDGQPFEFEHLGIDYEGKEIYSQMSMFFVSNKATNSDGLITEPLVEYLAENTCQFNIIESQDNIGLPDKPRFQGGIKDCSYKTDHSDNPSDSYNCSLFGKNVLGLHQLDIEWLSKPYRFSQYNNQTIALAESVSEGDTTQEVQWVEWVRGKVPTIDNEKHKALQPFTPRARTLKVSLQAMSQFSGQKSYLLATYRDIRFKESQILDPWPTSERYHENVISNRSECNSIGAYLCILPTHILEPNTSENEDRAELIKNYFFHQLSSSELPKSLFNNIENEISFGKNKTTDSLGGIATPDSPIGVLTKQQGPLGDNVFDFKRWQANEFDETRLNVPDIRYDFLKHRKDNNLSMDLYHPPCLDEGVYPFCSPTSEKILNSKDISFARELTANDMAGVPGVASLFGLDAEILPGISMMKIFKEALIDLGTGSDVRTSFFNKASSNSDRKLSKPPKWDYKVKGFDELLVIFGEGPGQISITDAVKMFTESPVVNEPGETISFGVEASLNWSTDALNEVDLGAIEFIPNSSIFEVNASASIDFIERKPLIQANASLSDFNIVVYKSLDVHFPEVAFSLDSSGNKNFEPKIGVIEFTGALSFINNLKSMLKSLEDYFGVKIDIKPSAIKVSQVIAIPPSTNPTEQGGAFYLGPVLITNLNIWWGIKIPLIGRDVLTMSFGLATRENPMAVYVPPYFGGKSHALMEVTTNGIRLFEVSIEFGGMIKVEFSIASGEVSLMAGTYLAIAKTQDSESFTLAAYVKLVGELVVAGFIHFHGLIQITLSYTRTSGGDYSGKTLVGEAVTRVSIKIGFVRYSYSFTAREEQSRRDQSSNKMTNKNVSPTRLNDQKSGNEKPELLNNEFDPDHNHLFQVKQVKDRWEKFIDAYAY